ncbi:single-stranded DNA-binding protein [Subtercola sp. PAMC28395]|uniref:single-stranded DNA-binding protein n=1 Tax=Subtercola sp. PAMC28395 TaxID=2846775 RepID=UPI001C0AA380|nr:single-stranded DNA-binding protein [Subtercola sp. PAMC28395]QWT22916.1 single-stranded DNA-binding protein [Subtercola sp. PAMC28395]
MTDTISLTGVVATEPRFLTTNDGLEVTTFRLASSQRRFDRNKNAWVDAGTNWYTVASFRQLASNLAQSISKGDRVVATGRLRIREWQGTERAGITVEIEADSVGHDLAWGRSVFTRTAGSSAGAQALSRDASSRGQNVPAGSGSRNDLSDALPAGQSAGGQVHGGGFLPAGDPDPFTLPVSGFPALSPGGAADWNSSLGQGVAADAGSDAASGRPQAAWSDHGRVDVEVADAEDDDVDDGDDDDDFDDVDGSEFADDIAVEVTAVASNTPTG